MSRPRSAEVPATQILTFDVPLIDTPRVQSIMDWPDDVIHVLEVRKMASTFSYLG